MRRAYLFAGLLAGFVLLAGLVWRNAWGRAQLPGLPAARSDPTPEGRGGRALPLKQVVLFSSGVGYFQREGQVDGDTRLDLSFPAGDISDLLKSLVLHDSTGATVRAVSYQAQEAPERALRSFALDLTTNPSFGQLLNMARGERVEVSLASSAGAASVSGVIVGMESQIEKGNEVHSLNVLATEGVRRIPLTQVQRFRFLDVGLEQEFRRALGVLAGSRNTAHRQVSLHCRGADKRTLKVGYVIESPLWKASYRLVQGKGETATLHAWGIVDNTTDEDWREVRLALVSSRPLSFQMDLYQPLFVPRPRVEPEQFAALRPPVHEGALVGGLPAGGRQIGGLQLGGVAQRGLQLGGIQLGGGIQFGGMPGGAMPGAGEGEEAPTVAPAWALWNRYQLAPAATVMDRPRLSWEELLKRARAQREARAEAEAQARRVGSVLAGVEGGDLALVQGEGAEPVRHTVEEKLTLPRQRSALLPVLTKEVTARPISIYNEAYHPRHPLRGALLTNGTGQALMHGPVTVFEDTTYLGDARLPHLQPGEQRLVSFAIDVGVEVKSERASQPERRLGVAIDRGVLIGQVRTRETRTLLFRNRDSRPRGLVAEHPIRKGWDFAGADKPAETTRDVHRFRWMIEEGKTVRKEIVEEKTVDTRLAISAANDGNLADLVREAVASKAVKDALGQVLSRRAALATVSNEMVELERQIGDIFGEQGRLRTNLQALPAAAKLRDRYLAQFEQLKGQLEKYRQAMRQKRAEDQKLRQELWSFVERLSAK